MINKIDIATVYTFFVLYFETCLSQLSTEENNNVLNMYMEDIKNNSNKNFGNEDDDATVDIDNLDQDMYLKILLAAAKNDGKMDENQADEGSNENEAGDFADLFGTNQHYNIPMNYQDFGRRFVLSYPYFERNTANDAAEAALDNAAKEHLAAKKVSNKLVPVKASPEFVLAIAKESALLEATKPKNPADEVIRKDILRTGDYWDNVWKEDIDPDKVLRSSNNNQNKLEPFTVQILPGSKLYDLVSILKQNSPRLLYVINKNNYE